jgi:hypothetical protein
MNAVFALTRMLAITGREVRDGMEQSGIVHSGDDLEAARAVADYVLQRIGVLLDERRRPH